MRKAKTRESRSTGAIDMGSILWLENERGNRFRKLA